MHFWGDKWFKKYGNQLYNAIDIFEYRIRKWAKCGVYGKEKYGTYRDEHFRMWDGSWSQILLGHKCWYRKWYEKIMWWLDYYLVPVRKTSFGWHRVGLANFNRAIGLVKLVNRWQARMINKAAQITCKEYPDVVDELLMDISFYKIIRPCKWGNVDGPAIHNKYWEPVNAEKALEELNNK